MDINDYVLAKTKCKVWGLTRQTVWKHLREGKIPGAIKIGNQWYIPKDAEKPKDRRFNFNK